MPAINIPDPLPPAITPPRSVIEFLIERHVEEFGDNSLVTRTWQWVLHGGGRGPISHMDWTRFDGNGPPSAATLAAESTASEPPLYPPTRWDELNRARFICWLCTSQPEDELPLRFHPWDAAPAPAASEEGSVTITMHEIRGR
jgi:hypothetical protein